MGGRCHPQIVGLGRWIYHLPGSSLAPHPSQQLNKENRDRPVNLGLPQSQTDHAIFTYIYIIIYIYHISI